MSEAGSGSGAGSVGTPAVSANTAGDAQRGAQMPSVPEGTERMSARDFMKAKREGKLPVRAEPAQKPREQMTSRERVGEFSRQLEAKQAAQQGKPDPNARPSLADEDVEQDNAQFSGLQNQPAESKGAEQTQEAQTEAAELGEQSAEGGLTDAEIIQRYREWETSDLAPEEIFADKLHSVKVRGQERFVDYNELRQGYMRGSDYSTAGKELKARAAEVDAKERSYKEHFETIKDPDQFLEIYERNGYSEQLEQVAERIAQRRSEHRGLVRAAGRAAAERLGFTSEQIQRGEADNHRDVVAAMQATDSRLKQARSVEIENRKLAFERQRFEDERKQAAHAQEVAKHRETYDRQLNQLRPGAFKAHGIQDSAQNRTAFLRHLQGVIELEGFGDQGITRAMVMTAARNLREEAEDRLQNEQGAGVYSEREQRARAQAEQRRALPANRTSTGAGKPLQAQNQARRPSEFAGMRRAGTLGKY